MATTQRPVLASSWLAATLICLLWSQSVLGADNWEAGKPAYATECAGCHRLQGEVDATKQPFPPHVGEDITTLTNLIIAKLRGTPPPTATLGMRGYVYNTDPLLADTNKVSDIAAYLTKPNFPTADLSPASALSFSNTAVGKSRSLTVRVTNNGDRNLDVTGASLNVADSNFAVNGAACAAAVAPAAFCDIQVTFQPLSAVAFNRTLSITHNAFGSPDTLSVTGTGVAPLVVAPTTLQFTPILAPTGLRQLLITDNAGDLVRVCRGDAGTFNFPQDFTFTVAGDLTTYGNSCFTTGSTVPLPPPARAINLEVKFTAGGIGPRNASLVVQRVTGGGAAIGSAITVNLVGNPGALATVNASSLFDGPTDPGVEVDNDNVLDRTVTLFSQGSDPLVFTGTSFVISGPNAGEYALAGGSCLGMAGLAASTGGTPPSCELNVRFNPSDVGRRGPATLTLAFAGTADNTISLNGLGIRGPRLAVRRGLSTLATGDTVLFGTPQVVGGLYEGIAITLANGGTVGNLEVALPPPGSIPGFGYVAGPGCASIPAGATCTVSVSFAPTAVQAYVSQFVVQSRPAGSSDPFANFSLELRGEGVATAVPVVSWTDMSGTAVSRLDFPETDTGAPVTRSVRLFNAGRGGVTVEIGNVVGSGNSSFVIDSADCAPARQVFEGTSCVLTVQFAPTTAGQKIASVQLAARSGTGVLLVAPLLEVTGTGRGVAPGPVLDLRPGSQHFGSIGVGASSQPVAMVIANPGSAPLSVTNVAVTGPFQLQGGTCGATPFTVVSAGECTLNVTFVPLGPGSASGTLRITSSANPSTRDVALAGDGLAAADVSGGGCSMADGDARTDPTLHLLLLGACAALFYRWRSRKRGFAAGRGRR